MRDSAATADGAAMEFEGTEDLTARARRLGTGPCLMLLAEDGCEIEGTLRHHLRSGFRDIVLALPPGVAVPRDLPDGVHRLTLPRRPDDMATACVNALIAGRPSGSWTGWAYNAEYLFHPFAETRRIGEAMAFCSEERRDAIPTNVIDLYAGSLDAGACGVDAAAPWMDASGYYALSRVRDGALLDRQLDMFGGLRWRFEEHVPPDRRRIDRASLFRTRPGLRLLDDRTLSIPEMNTVASPWHHSMTACVASFHAAKALSSNPGSRATIDGFRWAGSVRFEWRAQQLMELGLMEPGQWF